MLDHASLLVGIVFSGVALVVAQLVAWVGARSETHLLHCATGIGLIVSALSVLGAQTSEYSAVYPLLPYCLVLGGMGFIYSSSRLLNHKSARAVPVIAIGTVLSMAVPMLAGWTGIGTINLNASAALVLSLCGWEFWRGRPEAPLAMTTNSIIYFVTAATFMLCALVLAVQQRWVLVSAPNNWAEDINSVVSVVGFMAIAAITLTLHHARAARHHRMEASTDALTGLLNRRGLSEEFDARSPAASFTIIMFDLDRFKLINDNMGHAHGDEVLKRFADTLRTHIRATDRGARLGGEEFCAVLAGRELHEAAQVAERIRLAFQELALNADPAGKTATVSAGIAIAGKDEPFSSVLSRADAALYKAKQAGRNQVHIAPFRLVA